MTVTDLVRDTCKTAARMVQRGDNITVKSGDKKLFRIVPVNDHETQMTPRQYKSFVKNLNAMASKANLDDNPIVRMRQERDANFH
ncbi:MAG: hypothetical protein ABI042_18565 [Verrucomicrobiota bacterium]